MSALRTIATIKKNNAEEIRVSVGDQGGYTLVDLRVFSAQRSASGEPHPTKAGICLVRTKLPELIKALQAAAGEGPR